MHDLHGCRQRRLLGLAVEVVLAPQLEALCGRFAPTVGPSRKRPSLEHPLLFAPLLGRVGCWVGERLGGERGAARALFVGHAKPSLPERRCSLWHGIATTHTRHLAGCCQFARPRDPCILLLGTLTQLESLYLGARGLVLATVLVGRLVASLLSQCPVAVQPLGTGTPLQSGSGDVRRGYASHCQALVIDVVHRVVVTRRLELSLGCGDEGGVCVRRALIPRRERGALGTVLAPFRQLDAENTQPARCFCEESASRLASDVQHVLGHIEARAHHLVRRVSHDAREEWRVLVVPNTPRLHLVLHTSGQRERENVRDVL
mmetsp:Transcript_46452/g.100816  ORF Transcript_46452/g.100816 Transcript_46452/m.100816 type:complete len:317 (+) Transcript_46452:2-952(+)